MATNFERLDNNHHHNDISENNNNNNNTQHSAKIGMIKFFFNPAEGLKHFEKELSNSESPIMLYGYAFCYFLSALLKFREKDQNEAFQILELTINKLNKIAEGLSKLDLHTRLQLEALQYDCVMFQSLLHFSKQNVSGFIKGGYAIQKTWKAFSKIYNTTEKICKTPTPIAPPFSREHDHSGDIKSTAIQELLHFSYTDNTLNDNNDNCIYNNNNNNCINNNNNNNPTTTTTPPPHPTTTPPHPTTTTPHPPTTTPPHPPTTTPPHPPTTTTPPHPPTTTPHPTTTPPHPPTTTTPTPTTPPHPPTPTPHPPPTTTTPLHPLTTTLPPLPLPTTTTHPPPPTTPPHPLTTTPPPLPLPTTTTHPPPPTTPPHPLTTTPSSTTTLPPLPTTTTTNIIINNNNNNDNDDDNLRNTVYMGYGMFHLMLSMIPQKFLKLANILGFTGDRRFGLECLYFVINSKTDNIRTPLACIVLLWYKCIFQTLISLDPTMLTPDKLTDHHSILARMSCLCANTSIVTFYTGRLSFLACNHFDAQKKYEACLIGEFFPREMSIISHQEIAFLLLLKQDFNSAEQHFKQILSYKSVFAGVYEYWFGLVLGIIGEGKASMDAFTRCMNHPTRGLRNPLERFAVRRSTFWLKQGTSYISMLLSIYEQLYMINYFRFCDDALKTELYTMLLELEHNVENNIQLCTLNLLLAGLLKYLNREKEAQTRYREILNYKTDKSLKHEKHLMALATLEIAVNQRRIAGNYKQATYLLNQALQNFGDYDFESRIHMCIHNEMQLNKLTASSKK